MSRLYSFVDKSSHETLKKYPGVPDVDDFDGFIEKLRRLITTDVEKFRRDIERSSLSSVYVYLRDSAKFMSEYLHLDFPSGEFLGYLEEDSVDGFDYRLRSSLKSLVLYYLIRLYDGKSNDEKMRIYKNRVLSMKFLREFYCGSTDFDIMDLVIDDLEELIDEVLAEDEETKMFMFSSGDNVAEKGKVPPSTDLEGYNWREVFQESRVRNRKNNNVPMEKEPTSTKEQERARKKNKTLDQDFAGVAKGKTMF